MIKNQFKIFPQAQNLNLTKLTCSTGSWGILAPGDLHLGEVLVGECASWGKGQFGDLNQSDFLDTIARHLFIFIESRQQMNTIL